MDVQKLEFDTDLRVKFASINEKGGYEGDAHEEYAVFFAQLNKDWSYVEVEEPIETRFEWTRNAWVLTHEPTQTQIAAVEHETGIEILVSVGAGIVSTVAAEAIISFVKWGWGKWNSSRDSVSGKVNSSLVVESVTDRFPDGRIRRVDRLEIREPLKADLVSSYVEQSLTKLVGDL